ncbi:hypothetical protein ACO2Q3_11095 [Caulobacter sp. KR2-114]|uniref:hypothetical protein n=1 Tax=Caulobacter sp. KR2-114 TaxID=3400912 RepID=UPI003C0A2C1D
MRRAEIEQQNRYLVQQQRGFRVAADVAAKAWMGFAEVSAVAVIGSVARPLWKEVPRFAEFRRAGIEVWHECSDLDLALWVDHLENLGALRRALSAALQKAFSAGAGTSVPGNLVDTFLFEPASDRYLGRLCRFNACPKGHRDCWTPGCGDIPFNKIVDGFQPWPDLLEPVAWATLYRRGEGLLRSALDLPQPPELDGESPNR